MPKHQPRWAHSSAGLAVALGLRTDPIPPALAGHLQNATTADPAEDLVELEGKLRATVATLTSRTNQAEHSIADARRKIAEAGHSWSPAGWLRRRSAKAELSSAIARQSGLRDSLDQAVIARDTLREFVIGLGAPFGLLGESSAGWQRSADIPASVVVFGPEDSFVAADSRRMDSGWASARVAGEIYGEQWRRDGDDDGPYSQPLDRAGPWRIGFIPHTGEVYASRHCGYLPEEVWLLGRDFEAQRAHTTLDGLLPRMREPNSLILAAGVVHAARSLRSTPQRTALRLRGTQEPQAHVAEAGDLE
ncbi:hypothetical protein SK854_00275 [Lentzea sp. BCCO 10_0061]|uniref:Uncharacterized protein n=1 Tax=Lentzea sokolovensis TaxID=3095429 RepID=A0ABU4UM89_9PSEU|nr:hypothetical protein [Lentzea sp. BCCO 10_0061]MDX8140529.1 hypothetical protein [Lentzea sp. BCCO 10_0061]